MELHDIKESISNLSDDELKELFKNIRTNRRTPRAVSVSTKAKPAKVEKPVSIDTLLSSISPDQIDQILAALESQK